MASTIPTHPLVLVALHDRIVGSLVGAALGDAVGLYTEFLTAAKSRQAYPACSFRLTAPATPFRRDWHRGPHLVGEWTDDTDHACLVLLAALHGASTVADTGEAAAATPLPDPVADFVPRLAVWVREGLRALDTLPLGLGHTVGSIVRSPGFLADPPAVARAVWARGGRNLAPNGSLMRAHPLAAVCLHRTPEETFAAAARLSMVTHVDPRCVVSCVVGTGLVRGLIRGEVRVEADMDGMIEQGLAWYETWRVEEEDKRKKRGEKEKKKHGDENQKDEIDDTDPPLDMAEFDRYARARSLADLQLDEAGKIGYVYKTLGAGLLLLRLAVRDEAGTTKKRAQTALFERLITDLTMEGGDADTNACFAGALLGAYAGYCALPAHWRDGLTHGEWLVGKAEALCRTLGVLDGDYDGRQDPETRVDGGREPLSEKQMEERWMLLQARMARDETELNRQEREEAKERRGLGGLLSYHWKR